MSDGEVVDIGAMDDGSPIAQLFLRMPVHSAIREDTLQKYANLRQLSTASPASNASKGVLPIATRESLLLALMLTS